MGVHMGSFTDHEDFEKLAPWVRIETYARDGGHEHPRKRIELAARAPQEIVNIALDTVMPCVACGNTIHPFRQRGASKRSRHAHIYFAAACPLDESVGCSRGHEARDEYLRVIEAVLGTPSAFLPEPQLGLFGAPEPPSEPKHNGDEKPKGAKMENEDTSDVVQNAHEDIFQDGGGTGMGIFDPGALPGPEQEREDQLMGALVVLRSAVDALRSQVRALYVALAIVIVVLLGATFLVLR